MLSKKSFLADEQNFSAPLVGPMLGNVRDYIESQQNDHRPSYMSYRGLRRPRQLEPDFCEIFGAPQFSTFSTASVIFGSPRPHRRLPIFPRQRTSSVRVVTSDKCQQRKSRPYSTTSLPWASIWQRVVIRAARLAAILPPIARGLRPAKGPARF